MKKDNIIETSPEIIVGLDIGTTKIATIIGYKNSDGKIDILGYGKGESTGVQHGLIFNINKTVDGINISKNSAVTRSNQEIDNVFVGVAGRHIRSMEYKHVITRRNGKDEIIRQEEINSMIDDLENISVNPGEKIITVIPQRFIIDNIRETVEPVGELGEVIVGYFQIITGNENEIKKIIRCVNSAGLNVEDVILEPIASGMSCLSQEEKRQGVVLIDIGGGTTDIAIYVDGNPVYTKVIPIGGNIITKDIAQVCQITEELAEKLKISYGTCIVEKSNSNNYITIPQFHGREPIQISETYLAKIINMRVQEDILNQVKKEIENSGYAKRILTGVVMTGGGATLKHLKELCQYTLQKPTRVGIPEFGFVSSVPTELKHPMYSTSLGLLKYGIDYYDSKMDQTEENITKIPSKKTKETKKESSSKTETKGDNKMLDEMFKSIQKFFENILEKTS